MNNMHIICHEIQGTDTWSPHYEKAEDDNVYGVGLYEAPCISLE